MRRSPVPLAGASRTVTVDRLHEVLPGADLVIIAAALTAETSRLIGEAELAFLRPEAVLVNIARGGLADTDALTAALAAGRLAGADTPEMTAPLLAERIRLNVSAFLGDGRFIGLVDPAAGY